MDIKLFRNSIFPLLVVATIASVSGAYAADIVAKVGSTSLGKIVVDSKGMSAYFFDLSGIKGAVGSIALKGGGRQVTINGRPIYTFAFDKAPGQAKGEGAQGVWYVISPSGKEIKALKLASKISPSPTKVATYGKSNY